MKIKIRKFLCQDLQTVSHIFNDTVNTVNSVDYTPEQLSAWVNRSSKLKSCSKRLSKQKPFFEKRGYIVSNEHVAERLGVKLKNYEMYKNTQI